MNEDRKKLEKRMMSEEYGRDFAGCLKAIGIVVILLVALASLIYFIAK